MMRMLGGALRSNAELRERGFTVVEAILALVVLLIALLALMGIVPAGFSSVQQNSTRVQAIAAGQQYLDSIRQSMQSNPSAATPAPPTIAVDPGDSLLGTGTANSGLGNFSMQPNCTAITGTNSRAYDCTVTIHWTVQSTQKTELLETYVAQQ
jgi:Tfp pilus assembly protein PilV